MKKLNSLKLKDYSWNDIDVFLTVEEYVNWNQLAIMLYEKETGEYYTDLSVFVKEFPIYQMDLDELAKYDPEWVHKFIKDNKIKVRTIWDNLRQN